MKELLTKNIAIFILSIVLIITTSIILFAYPSGFTNRTLKTSTQGCGTCHTHSSSVSGVISGPDTVDVGATVQFTLTISDPARNRAGLDVAVRLGVLDPGASSATIKLVSGELTQKNSLTMTNHTITIPFNYTAPSTPGIDTVFATVTSGTPAWEWAPSRRVVVRTISGIENISKPECFTLNQNFPNPFNPKTNISFSIPNESNVTLTVYDILGNELETLFEGELAKGSHTLIWNAENFASGLYFYKLTADNLSISKKMILSK